MLKRLIVKKTTSTEGGILPISLLCISQCSPPCHPQKHPRTHTCSGDPSRGRGQPGSPTVAIVSGVANGSGLWRATQQGGKRRKRLDENCTTSTRGGGGLRRRRSTVVVGIKFSNWGSIFEPRGPQEPRCAILHSTSEGD